MKINLVTIQTSLGVPISGKFIEEELGIEPVETDKRAKFFSPAQYEEIRTKLIDFLGKRRSIIESERPAPKGKPEKTSAASGGYANDDEF